MCVDIKSFKKVASVKKNFNELRNYLCKASEAMEKLYAGPLGSVDPYVPINIKETCDELNRENSILAQHWKRSSIMEWRSSKDKALHLH